MNGKRIVSACLVWLAAAAPLGAQEQQPSSDPMAEAFFPPVQAKAQEWQRTGRDLSPVAAIMQGFDPSVKAGKFAEAEAILDRALALLSQEPTVKESSHSAAEQAGGAR